VLNPFSIAFQTIRLFRNGLMAPQLLLILAVSMFFSIGGMAQRTVIRGTVTDSLTGEPLPFANILFPGSTLGTNSDYDGRFNIETSKKFAKLEARYLGYESQQVAIRYGKTQEIHFKLNPGNSVLNVVEVKSSKQKYTKKNNPAVELIEKVIDRKKYNRKANFDYYEYEKYEKLEFALSNVTQDFRNKKIFKSFQFLFENLDSSKMNGKPLLPLYLKENISDVWYRKEPNVRKELMKGERLVNFSDFMNDASLSEYFAYLYQDIDIYEANIPLFGNLFMSPIASLAPTFYRFYLKDTVQIAGDSCYRLLFYPKNRTDFLFQGELFISADGSYAVREVSMTVNKDINLNWVNDLAIRQRFVRADTLGYILEKDEIMADFGLSDSKMGVFGQRNVSYTNFKFNQPRPVQDYEGPSKLEETHEAAGTDSFWVSRRHDTLTAAEAGVYVAMDSLQQLPAFRRIVDIATILLAGYKVMGPVELGPINTFYSFNPVEGFRLRAGGRTTLDFSERLQLETYGAYGFKDKRFKFYGGATYSFAKTSISEFPRKELRMSYQQETKIPGQELQFIQEDNFLLSFKRGENDKWLYNQTYNLDFTQEFKNHFSYQVDVKNWVQEPAGSLIFSRPSGKDSTEYIDELRTMEMGLTLRWAPNEQFFQGKLYRKPLPNKYPIFTLRYGMGFKDLLGGEYNYQMVTLNATKRIFFPQLGFADLVFEGGRIFGQVPFPLLFIHRANQTYSYQLQSYNLMNFLEFVSDEYVTVHYNHFIGGFFFNKIPLFKRLKWREVFSIKVLYGGIRDENDPAIHPELYHFPQTAGGSPQTFSLEAKPYAEVSVGIYNIFKLFRVDYVRRLNYLDNPTVSQSGIRLRVRFEF
jgi:hypothetical protein